MSIIQLDQVQILQKRFVSSLCAPRVPYSAAIKITSYKWWLSIVKGSQGVPHAIDNNRRKSIILVSLIISNTYKAAMYKACACQPNAVQVCASKGTPRGYPLRSRMSREFDDCGIAIATPNGTTWGTPRTMRSKWYELVRLLTKQRRFTRYTCLD